MRIDQLVQGDQVLVVSGWDTNELSPGTVEAVDDRSVWVGIASEFDGSVASLDLDHVDVWYVLRESKEFSPDKTWHRLKVDE